ncbi:unnamed protein product [Brassica oleracea var. botrytis]|uniref:Uncharacterized protein n=1 Tax=Brassica oleracea TaxID=3712 RepID=A0A3P6AKF8_BRAOL|nr:unnamed protein product [Brassica oleracea]
MRDEYVSILQKKVSPLSLRFVLKGSVAVWVSFVVILNYSFAALLCFVCTGIVDVMGKLNYVVTAQESTSVTHSCVGNFTSLRNLVIAKCNRIEIHKITPQGIEVLRTTH